VCLTRAIDAFDLPGAYGSLDRAFAGSRTPFLLVGFSSDWLYPTWQLREIAKAVEACGGSASLVELQSQDGHDAFLTECDSLEPVVRAFLDGLPCRGGPRPAAAGVASNGFSGPGAANRPQNV
jgi:homoserine O-acetyltransferase/O-succinyltransferase